MTTFSSKILSQLSKEKSKLNKHSIHKLMKNQGTSMGKVNDYVNDDTLENVKNSLRGKSIKKIYARKQNYSNMSLTPI